MLTRGYELVHQAMGAEAKATVWAAESLARRYGHARVTPLHLASAILSSTRTARGLLMPSSAQQLWRKKPGPCIDAALSRLPVARPPPHAAMLAPLLPMSNALVTALKRAHKHSTGGWRRGRRPHLAAAKIELEHLVVSIVDDPSVYRAMKKPSSCSGVNPYLVEKGESVEQSNQVRDAGPLASNLGFHSSGDHPIPAKTGEGLVPFVAQYAATSILPSWLRHNEDGILTCRNTTLRATSHQRKFAGLSATNFKIMCDALALRVPRHKHITHSIASTVLWCRSGMRRRANSSVSSTTWLFFHGPDGYGKKDMAWELSNLIFGPYSALSLLNSTDSSGMCNGANKKWSPDGDNTYVMRRLLEVMQENPHRVVFIDGINQLDYESEIAIKNFIATGKIMDCNGNDMVNMEDAVIVLSTDEISSSRTKALSTLLNQETINTQNRKDKEVESRRFSLDEDVGEEQNLVGENVEIMNVADGVFRFD